MKYAYVFALRLVIHALGAGATTTSFAVEAAKHDKAWGLTPGRTPTPWLTHYEEDE